MKPTILCTLLCGSAVAVCGHPTAAARQADSMPAPAGAKVNRTVPNVRPPKTGLEFSAHPTTQEISRAGAFEEPLVPIGGEPGADENAALAAALLGYAKRSGPDDFASLTAFLANHPQSPWRAALLTCLGIEYYNTAYYSRALEAWQEAWALGQKATNAQGKFLADRAVCELAGLYSRLGRMNELEALLKSIETRVFIGGATERINIAREALSLMQHQPGLSFRCGPLALQSIQRSLNPQAPVDKEILDSASTQKGFSLPQVCELSKKVGLNYQMAFRLSSATERGSVTRSGPGTSEALRVTDPRSADFVVPSVVHWKVGHYAALVRQVGDRYLLEDPTFGNTVWATRQALEAETSGYFLIPPGDLPRGWRSVDAREGQAVWGKGVTGGFGPDIYTPNDLQTGTCQGDGTGMAVSSVHLMLVNLQIRDTPVGYTPPVGPPVHFTVRYNHRDYLQLGPDVFALGPRWTHDWAWYISDNPQSPLADVKCIVGGGGARTFTRFDTNTQTFAPNQYDQTVLKRTDEGYELTWPDGSRLVFEQSDGTIGTSRRIYLTGIMDPFTNVVRLLWDAVEFANGRAFSLSHIVDALGQVTTFIRGFQGHLGGNYPFLITEVIDPFGRRARFNYVESAVGYTDGGTGTNFVKLPLLFSITDVLGMGSLFQYQQIGLDQQTGEPIRSDQIIRMITPYGAAAFFTGQGGGPNGTTRFAETHYPDGSRDRVEFNQSENLGIPNAEPLATPAGMSAPTSPLAARNTYHWSRTANASSHGDHTKAKIYHWLHAENIGLTAGILESIKEPLEGRVWYNYAGQHAGVVVGSGDRPTHIGRVLEDGQTQLYLNAYNGFGNLTNSVDPLGRTFSFLYDSNGLDLLEVRQTRAGNNELLARATYNSQHLPLTTVDAAGQTNTFTYNARGQRLTATNPKGETTTYAYDPDGYLVAVDGPLPGTNDVVTATYDGFGRTRTLTGLSGYTLTFDYDFMDRMTNITHPDSTFEQFTYALLDMVAAQDRAGRQTLFEYDNMRQLKTSIDPLGRVTRFEWCRCGEIKSLTDPMGRTTSWLTDVQGRVTAKQYGDGSQVSYVYESSSRLKHVIDEKQQVTQFIWNRDDTVKSMAYGSATVKTPGVSFTYDPNYARITAMADGTGTTLYSYNPVTGTPTLGAGASGSVDGPLPNDTVTYAYDELGRSVHRAINGVGSAMTFDDAGRLVGMTNALGAFTYGYDGVTARMVSKSLPGGQTEARSYGNVLQDLLLQRITHKVGATPISEFLYGHDVSRGRIATWSQQAGAQPPSLHTFGYDAVNQLLSTTVTNAGSLVNAFAYSYDRAANRLTEQVGGSNYTATYNALNEISTTTAPGITRTNEWDALDRLVAVNVGNQRTEFAYDGLSRRVAIRQLVNGAEVSHRRFVWCIGEICEERDAAGAVTKRFFPQGMKVESGPNAGNYLYTRDHLGSIRELTDSGGSVRARYAYDPYGRRTKLTGDMEADFGFVGMFWSAEANLSLTHYRAYDPELGRWLSRDPLENAEFIDGPNLYAYVANDPVNHIDPEGLIIDSLRASCFGSPKLCITLIGTGLSSGTQYLQRNGQAALQAGGRALNAVGRGVSRLCSSSRYATDVSTRTLPGMGPANEAVALRLNTQLALEVEYAAIRGAQYMQQLIDEGQLFGRMGGGIGPRAHRAINASIDIQMRFFHQLKHKMPSLEALVEAERKAIEFLGYNTDLWLPGG